MVNEVCTQSCYTLPHTFRGAELGKMPAELLPAVPGVLCDVKPAADGHAAAPTWVRLAVPVVLGVTWWDAAGM